MKLLKACQILNDNSEISKRTGEVSTKASLTLIISDLINRSVFAQSGFAYYGSWKARRKLVLTPKRPVSWQHHFIRNVADVSITLRQFKFKADLSFLTIFIIHLWHRSETTSLGKESGGVLNIYWEPSMCQMLHAFPHLILIATLKDIILVF